MTFDEINGATGFANGDYFETEAEVLDYFRWAATEFDIPYSEAEGMAEEVVENGWHFRPETRHIAVTLRQLKEADVPLIGGFGIDEDEHAELLDEPGLLRIAATYGNGILQGVDVECFQARPGQGARWESCVAWAAFYELYADRIEQFLPTEVND